MDWAKRSLIWSGEAYLSYSLGALALIGFSVACFATVNEIAYPSIFYGPVGTTAQSIRASLATAHATFGSLALLGHLWHAYRARSLQRGVRYNTFFDFVGKDLHIDGSGLIWQLQLFKRKYNHDYD